MTDRDGSIAWRSQYVDDAVGNEIKEIIYDGEENVGVYYEYAYDKYENRIKEISCDSGGNVNWFRECAYDASGNLVKRKYFSNSNVSARFLEQWTQYIYDTLGNQLKEIHYNPDGSVGYYKEHDIMGNLIFENESGDTEEYIYQYAYVGDES